MQGPFPVVQLVTSTIDRCLHLALMSRPCMTSVIRSQNHDQTDMSGAATPRLEYSPPDSLLIKAMTSISLLDTPSL